MEQRKASRYQKQPIFFSIGASDVNLIVGYSPVDLELLLMMLIGAPPALPVAGARTVTLYGDLEPMVKLGDSLDPADEDMEMPRRR